MPRCRLAIMAVFLWGASALAQPRPNSGYVPLDGQVPSDVGGWFNSLRGRQAQSQFDQEGMKRLSEMLKGRSPEQLESLLKNREQFKNLIDQNKGQIDQFMRDPKNRQKIEDFKKMEEFRKFLDRRPPTPNANNEPPKFPPTKMEPQPPGGNPKTGEPDGAKIQEWLEDLERDKKQKFEPDAKKFDPKAWADSLKELPKVNPDEFPKPPQTPGEPPTPPSGDPNLPNPTGPPPSPPSSSDPRAEEFDAWLTRTFGDSKATREMADSFGKMLEGKGLDGMQGGWLDDLNSDLGGFNEWAGTNWGGGNFNLPNVNTGGSWFSNWPSWGNRPRVNAPSLPRTNFGSGGGLDFGNPAGLFKVILIAVAVIGGLALLAFILARRQREEGDLGEALPPEWLAALRQARTREELVKLFEALSFTRIGKRTRTWHHRLITDEMGRFDARAADELAGLYEVARYSPPAQQMADSDFDRANADAQALNGDPEARS